MPNLDNLINKILRDGEKKAEAIIDEANKKAEEIIKDKEATATREKNSMLLNARQEADMAAERITLANKQKIRDNVLKAKQEAINNIFIKATEKLNNMSKDEYFNFLRKYLPTMDIDGDEILIPTKYGIKNADEINNILREQGRNGNLTLYNGQRSVDGGFVLIKNGVESNNSFKALVDYRRYELEREIIEILF